MFSQDSLNSVTKKNLKNTKCSNVRAGTQDLLCKITVDDTTIVPLYLTLGEQSRCLILNPDSCFSDSSDSLNSLSSE